MSLTCACGCGATVLSPDAKGRPRRFARGHNLRVDHPKDRLGYKPAFAGRSHTPETRAVLSEKASRPKPWLRGDRNGMAGRTGSNNPNWRGGGSPERQRLYASAEWKAVRRKVFARDGYRCASCGELRHGAKRMHLHHVKPWATHPELRLDPDNLIVLCADCHRARHREGVKP